MVEYLIKWKDWDDIHNSWEPLAHLGGCQELLDEFHAKSHQIVLTKKRHSAHFRSSSPAYDSPGAYRRSSYSSSPPHSAHNDNSDNDDDTPLKQHSQRSSSLTPITRRFPTSAAYDQTDLWSHILSRAEGPPIKVINEVDADGPPTDFTYVNRCIFSPAIPVFEKSYLLGCKCPSTPPGRFSCNSLSCLLHYETGGVAYDNDGCVQVKRDKAIYECNRNSTCDPRKCRNRVVQNGPKNKLQIFKTVKRGWGVRALQYIPKGTFLATYTGEIITSKEAEERGGYYDFIKRTYLFDLDWFYQELEGETYTVDSFHYGNISHFFNHSCDPNIHTYCVFTDNQDERFHLIAFFASRDIEIGEEICLDYTGGKVEYLRRKNGNFVEKGTKLVDCHCGSKNCLGVVSM